MNANDSLELDKLKKEKNKARHKDKLKEVAQLCNVIGELLSKNGLYTEAISEHNDELAISEALEDSIGAAIACRKIGECYCELGEFDTALSHQNRYLEVAKACSNVVEEQRAWATLGRTYLVQSAGVKNTSASRKASSDAEAALIKSLELCETLKATIAKSEYMQMKARILLNLGLVYDSRDDVRTSAEYIKQAIDKTQKFDLHDDLYLCQCALSCMYQRHGNLSQAIRQLEEAQKSARKLKNKQLESDALCQKAMVFLQLGDYSSARRSLKLANKLGAATVPVQQQIQKTYNAAVQMEEITDDLQTVADDDVTEKGKLYEKLGDLAAGVENYKQALEFYLKLLDCAETEGRSSSDMIPVYVSLAQTYADDKQYERALEFYQRELQCHQDNPEQLCRTLLNIAEAQEATGENYRIIAKTYVQATEHARKAKHRRLQMQSLKSLIILQKSNKQDAHLKQTESKLKLLQDKYGLIEEEDESQGTEREEGQDVPISDLSDSDEEYRDQPVTQNAKRGAGKRFSALSTKRNEKGETPLHRACIEGNIRKVKKLVEQGHPINPRDFCGWLPLHEAANHDFPEVVEFLLSHGAWKNDRGGEHCGGVTPLLDAANCGNLDTMSVLIEHGANVLAKDDEGSSVLDCLRYWRDRADDTLSSEDSDKCNRMERLLLHKMGLREKPVDSRSRNSCITNEEELPDIRSNRRRNRSSIGRSPRVVEDSDASSESEIDDYIPPVVNNQSKSAKDDYRTVMEAVGSSGIKVTSQATNQNSRKSTNQISALIDANHNVGDDWLVEDVRPVTTKRKRGDTEKLIEAPQRSTSGASQIRKRQRYCELDSEDTQLENTENLIEDIIQIEDAGIRIEDAGIQIEDGSSNDSLNLEIQSNSPSEFRSNNTTGMRNSLSKKLSRKSRSRQLKLTNILSKSNENIAMSGPLTTTTNSNLPVSNRAESLRSVENPAGVSTNLTSVTTLALKIKVRVKDRLLLIPVPKSNGEHTVSWLANETCQRYYNLYGVRPQLQLSTKDNAVLSPDDLINVVLTDGEEVVAEVEKWELPPLHIRYKEACDSCKSVMYQNIRTTLEHCQQHGKLSLAGMALRYQHFQPIIRALQCQYNLKEINLSGNKLRDDGLKILSEVLDSLPSLSHLDISSNQITVVGLGHLCNEMDKALQNCPSHRVKPLQSLTFLSLGHNPLGDGCVQVLTSVIKQLPVLENLNLAGCLFTQSFFQHQRITLAEILKASTVSKLDVSFNSIGSTGIELLLWCLNPARVCELSLRATVTCQSAGNISKHLQNYTAKGDCILESLDLSDCFLSQADLHSLLQLLKQTKRLRQLVLNNNKCLDNRAVEEILKTSYEEGGVLERLEVRGCGLVSPLPSAFLDNLTDKLNGDCAINYFALSCQKLDKVDKDCLEQIWKDRWLNDSLCEFSGNVIQLSVKTNMMTMIS